MLCPLVCSARTSVRVHSTTVAQPAERPAPLYLPPPASGEGLRLAQMPMSPAHMKDALCPPSSGSFSCCQCSGCLPELRVYVECKQDFSPSSISRRAATGHRACTKRRCQSKHTTSKDTLNNCILKISHYNLLGTNLADRAHL